MFFLLLVVLKYHTSQTGKVANWQFDRHFAGLPVSRIATDFPLAPVEPPGPRVGKSTLPNRQLLGPRVRM
jgi:hypothetical protein